MAQWAKSVSKVLFVSLTDQVNCGDGFAEPELTQ